MEFTGEVSDFTKKIDTLDFDEVQSMSCSPRVILESLESKWMTIPLKFKQTALGFIITIEVIIKPQAKYKCTLQYICDESIKNKVMNAGRSERRFVHYAAMTSDGPVTKIKKIKIDHHVFEILEHFH